MLRFKKIPYKIISTKPSHLDKYLFKAIKPKIPERMRRNKAFLQPLSSTFMGLNTEEIPRITAILNKTLPRALPKAKDPFP